MVFLSPPWRLQNAYRFLSERRKGRAQVDCIRELYLKWPGEVVLEELNCIMVAQGMFSSRPIVFRTSQCVLGYQKKKIFFLNLRLCRRY